LLSAVGVSGAVSALLSRHLESVGLTAQSVLEVIRRLIVFDIRCLFDDTGRLNPLSAMSTAVMAVAPPVTVAWV
jgi:hypothetical protein